MNENDVLNAIELYFNAHQPQGYRLNVLRQGVRNDGDWWYVAVTPDRPDVRARDYAVLMEQAEDDLEAHSHLKVLLLPALLGD